MRCVFISNMVSDSWGGSEELWSQAALRLQGEGYGVSASVLEWSPLHPRAERLLREGMAVHLRPRFYPAHRRAWHKLVGERQSVEVIELERFLARSRPQLVVFSEGGALPPVELLELCIKKGLPFVTIGQANHEQLWPDDDSARRYRAALAAARRCFFVADANRRLAELQIGGAITNAEVVRNPFNVAYDAAPPWPELGPEAELRLACVGRLHPPSKGQDILLQALAAPEWRARRWRLSLYGEGASAEGISRLAERLGLAGRVRLAGHVSDIAGVWAEHHALVLPSRYEGMPLVLVEAMLCGRPVIATDVAGHSELMEDGVTGFLAEAPTVAALLRTFERAWGRQGEFEAMGKAGASRIRQLVPADPVGVFVDKLKALIEAPTIRQMAAE